MDRLPGDGTPHDEAALRYAELGWHVFPLTAHGKTPLTAHGFQDATVDQATILNWWGRWPTANIGIATGEKSNLVVLDVDRKADGFASFQNLVAAFPRPFLLSLIAGTGGGGFHVYYTHPGHKVGNSAARLRERFGPGLDLRGDGGYVAAPPSLHVSGRRYAWQSQPIPMEPWPDVLDVIVNPPPAATPIRHAVLLPSAYGGDLERYWRMVLNYQLDDLERTATNRNDALNTAAFRMGQVIAIGAPETVIVELLTRAGQAMSGRGDHPLTEAEVRRTIDSGIRAGRQHPDRWFRGSAAS